MENKDTTTSGISSPTFLEKKKEIKNEIL